MSINQNYMLTMFDGEYIEYVYDAQWRVCRAYSRYSMASMSSILMMLDDEYIEYAYEDYISTRDASVLEHRAQ